MKSLPNFKSSVPVEVQTKLQALSELATFDDIVVSTSRYGAMMEEMKTEIEGNYKSGWMPKQDGGFALSQYYQFDQESSYHFTEKQTDFANEQAKDCYASFLSDNSLDADTEWGDLTEEQKESLSEYEREWFQDGSLLSLEMFVHGYGEYSREPEKTITIRLSINYKDAPYFRESYAEDIKQIVLSISEFLEMPNEEIIAQFSV